MYTVVYVGFNLIFVWGGCYRNPWSGFPTLYSIINNNNYIHTYIYFQCVSMCVCVVVGAPPVEPPKPLKQLLYTTPYKYFIVYTTVA